MKGKKNLIVFCALLLLSIVFISPRKVEAAAKYSLKSGTTYTRFDVTGDGKKDKVKVSITRGRYEYCEKIKVTINNKTALTLKPDYCYNVIVKLCVLNNKKAYFFIEYSGDSLTEEAAKLYQYRGGKLKSVLNLRSLLQGSEYFYKFYSDIKSVSGNKITFSYGGQSYLTGPIAWNVTYKYSGGSFKRTAARHALLKKIPYSSRKNLNFTAWRKFSTYEGIGSKKKSFTVSAGKKVEITHICIKNKVVYFKVKNKTGKTGWMKGVTSKQYSKASMNGELRRNGSFYGYYFKDAVLAG